MRTLGESIATAASIHRLLSATARSRSALSVAYGLASPSTAMFTIAPPAFSTAACSSSRYPLSSERKCSLHGSIFLILNLRLTCAANSLNSIFPPPLFSSLPAMNSRNGYDAIAIRSRGAVGNRKLGPASAPSTVPKPANISDHTVAKTTPPAAVRAVRATNRLRVVRVKSSPV